MALRTFWTRRRIMYMQIAYTERFRAGVRRGASNEEATHRGPGTRRVEVRAATDGRGLPARDGRGDRGDRQGRERGTHGAEQPNKQPVRGYGLPGQPDQDERVGYQGLPERLGGTRGRGPRGGRRAGPGGSGHNGRVHRRRGQGGNHNL